MKQLLSYLQQELPAGLTFLEKMVNMDSPSTDKALVDRFARFVGTQFEALGGAVEIIPVQRFGDHLRVKFPGPSPETILLLGHTDTVFASGETAKRPFQLADGRATGPGVFDMKAGILLMWLALRALKARGATAADSGPLPSVTVLLTSDEEVGSGASRALLEAEAATARAVLVLEPSLPGGGLKTSRKGVGRYTVKAIGRAAHAGIEPEKGINAIEEIAHQVLKLQSMNEASRGSTLTVGVIQGGTRSNVVPAEAAVEVDVRVSTSEEASRMTRQIHGLHPHIPGARLEIRGAISRPPMERTADTACLFELARTIGAELGIDLLEGSTGGASDGNFTAAAGIPTLDGLGAIGDGAHSVDEYVDIASLPQRAALLAALIERIH